MKIFRLLVLLLMLVILPAISWYYLKTGMDYRVAAHDALQPKGLVSDWLIENELPSEDSLYLDKTSIVVVRNSSANDADLYKLFNQFKEVEKFQVVSFNQKEVEDLLFKVENLRLINVNSNSSSENKMALIDNKMQLRKEYKMDKEGFKELVAHTALTIPPKKSRDIKVHKTDNE